MDTREIQKLIDFISKSDLSEVNIETAELKLQIKRSSGTVSSVYVPVETSHATVQRETFNTPVTQQISAVSPVESTPSNLIEVKSPMIGTFYRSGGPGKPNFVEIGDDIAVGQTICIVEAMKLFNEIESEVSGKIVKVLVEDATPVEYDQVLFLVEPA